MIGQSQQLGRSQYGWYALDCAGRSASFTFGRVGYYDRLYPRSLRARSIIL